MGVKPTFLYTPRLIEAVFDEFADGPVDFLAFDGGSLTFPTFNFLFRIIQPVPARVTVTCSICSIHP